MKNANIANIRTSIDGLFEHWVVLTQPLHKLTEAESSVLLEFLKRRYLFLKETTDEEIVNRLLFSPDTRKEIMDTLGLKMGTFQNYLSTLRIKGALIDNKLNMRYVPNLEEGADNFKLIFNFNIKHG